MVVFEIASGVSSLKVVSLKSFTTCAVFYSHFASWAREEFACAVPRDAKKSVALMAAACPRATTGICYQAPAGRTGLLAKRNKYKLRVISETGGRLMKITDA